MGAKGGKRWKGAKWYVEYVTLFYASLIRLTASPSLLGFVIIALRFEWLIQSALVQSKCLIAQFLNTSQISTLFLLGAIMIR